MKMNNSMKILLILLSVSLWLFFSSAGVFGASPDPLGLEKKRAAQKPVFVPTPEKQVVEKKSTPAAVREATESEDQEDIERYVTIDFENVDIALFIKYISELTGKNFVIDKSIRGNVTIVSPTKISVDEAYKVFESVLEVQGFTTVPAGSVIKIVPSADARSKSVETGFSEDTGEITDKIVTQLIPLQYADPDELKKLFTPLVSKNSVVIAYPATSMLIITDVLSNINRLMQIIKEIDVEGADQEIFVIPIEYATASEVAKTLNTIFESKSSGSTASTRTTRKTPARGAAATSSSAAVADVKIMADERTNVLIVIGSVNDTAKVKRLIALLDKEIPRGAGNINVYYLQHANAEEMASVLTALPREKGDTAQKGKAPAISKEVQIVADKATNSLVITANKADYSALETVINKLDIPRRMVYLEALIMEVQADKEFAVGVEWRGAESINSGDGLIFGASRPGDSSVVPDVDNPNLPKGLAVGFITDTIEINGVTFPSLAAVLNAFKKDDDVHIISTPQILTTDNEEAEIKVGENVPYITSQNTTNANQDYTNYEYKDVGVTLKITPQINQENVVRLELFVESIKLKNPTIALLTNTPTTFQRNVQTTVIIEDGNTLVIGGIIGDDVQDSQYKVPLLGDIPGLGWMFKSESQSVKRVNLYVFITPKIIRNPAEALAITKEKRDHAKYHHETGWSEDTIQYKEDTREVLRERHIPENLKDEEMKQLDRLKDEEMKQLDREKELERVKELEHEHDK
jgi:general secretion pathway protein D